MNFNTLNFNLIDNNKYLTWLVTNFKKNLNFSYLPIITDLNIIRTVLYTLISKDTFFFSNWLKSLLETIYYKNHKKLLIGLKYLFFFLFKYLNIYLKIRGLKFQLKGKISLGGNSKKKLFSFNLGSYSLTKKNNYLYFNKNNVNTLSGSLGFYIFIFF